MRRWLSPLALLALAATTACSDLNDALLSPNGASPRLTVTTVSVVCPDTIKVGQSAQCVHYAYDQNNNLVSGTTATWSRTTPTLISVSSSGVITGLAVGNATVQATTGGVTGSRNVYVKPGLSISINGPSPVRRWQTCTWRAAVSNGTSPYTYTWSVDDGDGSGNGYEWTGYSISSGGLTLYVTVTDANGVTKTVSRFISVSTSAPSTC